MKDLEINTGYMLLEKCMYSILTESETEGILPIALQYAFIHTEMFEVCCAYDGICTEC